MFVKIEMEFLLAEKISNNFLELDRNLNKLLRDSKAQMSNEDFEYMCKAVGEILEVMYYDVMLNIYEKHPNLKPIDMP